MEKSEKPTLKKEDVNNLVKAYKAIPADADPEDRQDAHDFLKGKYDSLAKQYTIPEHENSVLEGLFKGVDTVTLGGPIRSTIATVPMALGRMRPEEALAGFDPKSTQLAPTSDRIMETMGVPTTRKYGEVPGAPTKEQLEPYVNEMEPGGSYTIPSTFFSKEGDLKNTHLRGAVGAGMDALLSFNPAKFFAKVPKVAKVVDAVATPGDKLLQTVEKGFYNFPSADQAAVKFGKGSTGSLSGSAFEQPVSEILKANNVTGATNTSIGAAYNRIRKEAGKRGAELRQKISELGAKARVEGRAPDITHTDLVAPQEITKGTRELIAKHMEAGGEAYDEGKRLLKIIDDIEGTPELPSAPKISSSAPIKVSSPKGSKVTGGSYNTEEASKLLGNYLETGTEIDRRLGKVVPYEGADLKTPYARALDTVQDMKTNFQKEVGASYKVGAKPLSDLEVNVKKQLARNAKEAIELRGERLIPEMSGELKKTNDIYGTLTVAEDAFVRDLRRSPLAIRELPFVAASTLGGLAAGTPKSAAIGATVGFAHGYAPTKTAIGLTAKGARQLPVDRALRSTYLNTQKPNAYEELMREIYKSEQNNKRTGK